MSVVARRLVGGGIVVAGVLGGLLMASTVVNADHTTKHRGEFGGWFPTSTNTYDADITGPAKMTVETGATKVSVELKGLDSNVLYTSHLHNAPCAAGGGGHYQDQAGVGADFVNPINEIWLSSFNTGYGITATGKGWITADGAAGWTARTDGPGAAQSVVIHGDGGVRVACADLTLD